MRDSIGIIGNFKGNFLIDDPRAGFLNNTFAIGIASFLEEFMDVHCYDISDYKGSLGITSLVSSNPSFENIFIIQNQIPFKIDHPFKSVFYFHIDGTASINPSSITHAFYLFNALRKHIYKVADNQTIILPFAHLKSFNPNRKKDIDISDIPRDITFEEYRDQLERSQFTIIKANHWLSKRIPEAWACKTIPIIISVVPEMQKRYCRGHAIIVNYGGDPFSRAKGYTQERVNKAYEYLEKYHTLENRVRKMRAHLKKYMT